MTSPDLTDPLDQEREASMADEGGAAGAAMEAQPGPRKLEAQPLSVQLEEVARFDPQTQLAVGERSFIRSMRFALLTAGVIGLGFFVYRSLAADRAA